MAPKNKPFVLSASPSDAASTIDAVRNWYEQQDLPKDWLPTVTGKLTNARDAMARFAEEFGKVRASDLYSERGRAMQMAELRDALVPHTTSLHQEARRLRVQATQECEAATLPQPKGIDAVLEQLQLQERRAFLRTLDPVDLASLYESAVRSGDDPHLERAIEGAPWAFTTYVESRDGKGERVPFNPITKELLAKGAETRALRLRPIVGDLETLAGMYEGIANDMAKEAGAMLPSDLDELARTGTSS